LSEQFYTDAERSMGLASSTREAHYTSKSKVKIMEISKETKAAVKPALWGAAAGAIALAIVGFSWGGWVTGRTAETIATNRAETAVVAALTPICVEKFRQAADASANLAEMKKTTYSWDQSKFVEKGGWATMPGSTEPNSAVAMACAASLGRVKAVESRG
jgi:pimeloyl-ACP methyl ester carboxylesterase